MFSLVGASDCRSSPGILDHLPKHLSLFPTHLGQSLRPSWLHSGIPFTSTLLSVILILSGVQGLQMPGWNVLGSIGIFLGLILLILDGKRQHEADQATLPSLRESLGD